MKRSRIAVVALMAAAMLAGTMSVVRAGLITEAVDMVPLPVKTYTYVYAAKFLCGEFDKQADPNRPAVVEGPVKTGNYQTIINVHNPQFTTVKLQKKAVLLFSGVHGTDEWGQPQPPSPLQPFGLESDWGVYIACPEIRKGLLQNAPASPTFIEGWVVIYSPALIDVETVVTSHTYNLSADGPAVPGFTREGFDTELERVQPTRVAGVWVNNP